MSNAIVSNELLKSIPEEERPTIRDLSGRELEKDVTKSLKQKKKMEMLEEYAKETGLSVDMLNILWTYCEKTPESIHKKMRKGLFKPHQLAKMNTIKRNNDYKDGETIVSGRIVNPEDPEYKDLAPKQIEEIAPKQEPGYCSSQ